MRLHFTPGSPFSRIVRVLLRELRLPCEEVLLAEFPPPPSFFAVNPLGQVPALETRDGVRFPTRLIIDELLGQPRAAPSPVASAVRRAPDEWRDDQLMSVLLALGDAIASIKYQEWAGLQAVGENLIGYDPADRHTERVQQALDWLETRAGDAGFLPGVLSAQDIGLACIVLWTDARGGFHWRGRPKLEAIVAHCAGRPSFAETAPQPWP